MDAAQDIDSIRRPPRRSMRCLVRLVFLVAPNQRQPVRLLPIGRRARSIKPRISGLTWTTESGHDLRSGVIGERISEGHDWIIAGKEMSAMQKLELALCLQCGQSERMTNTNQFTHRCSWVDLCGETCSTRWMSESEAKEYAARPEISAMEPQIIAR